MTYFPPDIIYIGLQKTGSTFLRNYFYSHPEIHCTRNGQYFQTSAADLYQNDEKQVRDQYEELFATNPQKPCRIDMYEAIGMGYVLKEINRWNEEEFIKVGSPLNSKYIFSAPTEIASRIKAVRPYARILITIRQQASWIYSNYRHFFDQLPVGKETFLDFLSTPEGKLTLEAARFDRVVDIYDSLFGSENVYVLPIEHLEKSENSALSDLCKFLGVAFVAYKDELKNANKGRDLDSLLASRSTASRAGLLEAILGRKESTEKLTTEEALQYISYAYAASNARLSSRLGLNLSDYGYQC